MSRDVPKAVVVGPFDAEALDVLGTIADVVRVPQFVIAEVRSHLADAEILVTRRMTIDAGTIAVAPRLRLIMKPGVGTDEIDVEAAARRGVAVLNTPGANAPAVAELTWGLVVGLLRKIPRLDARLRETHRWDRLELGTELYGKRLGIVGVGHVGSRVARVGVALDMDVIGCDPYIDAATAPVPLVPFEELLRTSALVSLHVPLSDETREMIGERALWQMPAGAVLVNMCRGEVVDEAAVFSALTAGRLAGYAADVLRGEAPGLELASPLLDHPNVLLTAHVGAWTGETDRRVCRTAVSAIQAWLEASAPR